MDSGEHLAVGLYDPDEPPPAREAVRADRWVGPTPVGRRAWLREEWGGWMVDVRVRHDVYLDADGCPRVDVVPELEWHLAQYEDREPGGPGAVGRPYEPWPAESVWIEP